MMRFVVYLLAITTITGCRSTPSVRTLVDGMMQMNGNMGVVGDMNMTGELATVMRSDNKASRLNAVPVYSSASHSGQPSVVVVDVDGLLINKSLSGLGSMGENPVAMFREKLDAIATNPNVAAIVLRLNSHGGGVTATDMMRRDLLQLKLQRNIPVVACVMDVGTGGAYYLASAADEIVAHPTSVVGGIGVILNLYNMEDSLGQFGIVSIPVKAGDRIDIASPERMMEVDERSMLQDIADQYHQRFIQTVSSQRTIAHDEIFDGRVVTGTTAEKVGLVDQVGYLDDAVVAARSLAGLPAESPVLMLRRDNDRAYTLLDVTPNMPTTSSIIPIKLPGLDRSAMPTFMYLWSPEPSMVTSSGG